MHTSSFHLELQIREQQRQAEPDGVHRRDLCILPVSRPLARHPWIELNSFELPNAPKAKADRDRGRTVVTPINRPRRVGRFYVPAMAECVRNYRLELHLALRGR